MKLILKGDRSTHDLVVDRKLAEQAVADFRMPGVEKLDQPVAEWWAIPLGPWQSDTPYSHIVSALERELADRGMACKPIGKSEEDDGRWVWSVSGGVYEFLGMEVNSVLYRGFPGESWGLTLLRWAIDCNIIDTGHLSCLPDGSLAGVWRFKPASSLEERTTTR